jgi:hypothetical protein
MKYQKVVVKTRPTEFSDSITNLLLNGWRITPAGIQSSVATAASERAGLYTQYLLTAVLEKEMGAIEAGEQGLA